MSLRDGAGPREDAAAAVLICGGDPIVGWALELLLRPGNYAVEYAVAPWERPKRLGQARVLLLAPRWDAESYRLVSEAAGGATGSARTTVLALGEPCDGSPAEPEWCVPWPCRMEDLTRRLDAILLAGTGVGGAVERGGSEAPSEPKFS